MYINKITLPSYAGRDLLNKHIVNNNSSLAVFFPGQNYSCELPLLYYTGRSALSNGYDLLKLEYGYQSARTVFEPENLESIIEECCKAIQQVINDYNNVCFVSKSLGTYIAGRTTERFIETEIKHLFLTPIKASIDIINQNGGTVIWGTQDESFKEKDIELIEGVAHTTVHRIEGANHGLEVEDLNESIKVLDRIINLTNEFFKN